MSTSFASTCTRLVSMWMFLLAMISVAVFVAHVVDHSMATERTRLRPTTQRLLSDHVVVRATSYHCTRHGRLKEPTSASLPFVVTDSTVWVTFPDSSTSVVEVVTILVAIGSQTRAQHFCCVCLDYGLQRRQSSRPGAFEIVLTTRVLGGSNSPQSQCTNFCLSGGLLAGCDAELELQRCSQVTI